MDVSFYQVNVFYYKLKIINEIVGMEEDGTDKLYIHLI